MKNIAEITKNIISKDFQEEEQVPQSKSLTPQKDSQISTESKFDSQNKQDLFKALASCQIVQRTYGKQAENLDKVTNIFLAVLNQYEPEKVIKAVKEWIKSSSEFPTPADIESILNSKPKFDYAVYQSLQRERSNGTNLTSEQWKYLEAYEQNVMKGL